MNSPDAYTNPREHLSQDQLNRYRQGNMADAEMHRVERHLLECDLCNDAAEGLEMLDPGQSGRALQDLEETFHSRLLPKKQTVYWKWGIAASVLVLAGSLFFLLNRSFKPEDRQNNQLVQRMPEAREESQGHADSQEHLQPHLSNREEEKEKKSVREEKPVQTEEENTQPAPAPERADREAALPQAREEPEREGAVSPVYAEEPSNEVSQDLVLEEILLDYAVAKKEVYRDSVADRAVRSPSSSESTTRVTSKEAKRFAAPPYKKKWAERDTLKSKTLKGKVIDRTGEPLPGVNIRLAGSRKIVVSNLSGEYSLQVPVADTAVQISYVGYEPQKLFVPDSATQLLAVLQEDVASLNEVVVMGYDPGQRKEVTGAESTVPEIIPPRPAGGRRSFKKYLKQNQRYTARARDAGIAGVVVLEFYVEEDSTFSDFQVRKSLGYGLDEEAIRLVKEGPAWQPATSGNKTIRHKAKVKVRFRAD